MNENPFNAATQTATAEALKNALQNMAETAFPVVFAELEKAVKDDVDSQGEVQLNLKATVAHGSGKFFVSGLAIKWGRKVGKEDKDFETVVIEAKPARI
jgi:hypothetical protein